MERLRARLGDDKHHSPADKDFQVGKNACGPLQSRVVDIPSATKPKPNSPSKRQKSRGGGGTETRSDANAGHYDDNDDDIVVSPTGESIDQGPEEGDGDHRCSAPNADSPPFARSAHVQEEEQANDKSDLHNSPRPIGHQCQHQQQRQRYRQAPSTAGGRYRTFGGGRGQRRSRHGGEALVSSRARAGLLGVLAPGGSRGYLTIDEPIATVSSGRGGGDGVSGRARVDGRDAGGEAECGRERHMHRLGDQRRVAILYSSVAVPGGRNARTSGECLDQREMPCQQPPADWAARTVRVTLSRGGREGAVLSPMPLYQPL